MSRKKEKAIDTTRILIIIVIILIFLMLAVLGKMALDMINGAKNAKNETVPSLPSASAALPEESSAPPETQEPAASSLEPVVTESESPSELPTEETTEPTEETTPPEETEETPEENTEGSSENKPTPTQPRPTQPRPTQPWTPPQPSTYGWQQGPLLVGDETVFRMYRLYSWNWAADYSSCTATFEFDDGEKVTKNATVTVTTTPATTESEGRVEYKATVVYGFEYTDTKYTIIPVIVPTDPPTEPPTDPQESDSSEEETTEESTVEHIHDYVETARVENYRTSEEGDQIIYWDLVTYTCSCGDSYTQDVENHREQKPEETTAHTHSYAETGRVENYRTSEEGDQIIYWDLVTYTCSCGDSYTQEVENHREAKDTAAQP